MVPHVVHLDGRVRVHHLEVFHTGQLILMRLDLSHDRLLIPNAQFAQQGRYFLQASMLVGASMVIVGIGCIGINNLTARIRRIVGPFSLFAIHVAPIVGIILVKVLRKHAFKVHESVF